MLTAIFPGQGSQFTGMGTELFEQFPNETKQANDILGYSISELCQSNAQRLSQTQLTQPALFVVNALAYLSLYQKGLKPRYFAGHSLGEINALWAAKAFDFITGLQIAQKRGELMAHAASDTGMLAVVETQRDKLSAILNDYAEKITLANDNSPTQIVLAGKNSDLATCQTKIEAVLAGKCIPLLIGGAFHSPYMQSIEDEFRRFIATLNIQLPRYPVYSNVDAQPYRQETLFSNMTLQLTRTVQWTKTITNMMTLGPMLFLEIGAKKILTRLINEIVQSTEKVD